MIAIAAGVTIPVPSVAIVDITSATELSRTNDGTASVPTGLTS
jgi:hypothetical protein